MLNDEKVAWYKQLIQEYKDVFSWEYQDTTGLGPNIVVHKLAVSKAAKPINRLQSNAFVLSSIQMNAEIDKFIIGNFILDVQYLTWLANIVPIQKKNGQLRICVGIRT